MLRRMNFLPKETNKSVVVNSTVALWFRIVRVFGMAPVSIRSDRDGYRISVCTYSALYGYIIGVVFTISYMGYIYNVIRVGLTPIIIDRRVWCWTVDFGLILAVVDPIIAGGTKLQSVMINDLIALNKVETTFTLLSRFKNRVQTLGRKVVKHLDIFVDLTLEKAYYSPLGLFTIKTSLVATTITAMTTIIAVVFQFQSES
ncbi:unnamed protein product [Colias eurytheme]|nr:unnamed protein product [Colias eurytheme]